MKILSSLATAATALLIAANSVSAGRSYAAIAYPIPKSISILYRGKDFTFKLVRQSWTTSELYNGLTIRIQSCGNDPQKDLCDHNLATNQANVVKTTTFSPRWYKPEPWLYQNITIDIPTDIAQGRALLVVKLDGIVKAPRSKKPPIYKRITDYMALQLSLT